MRSRALANYLRRPEPASLACVQLIFESIHQCRQRAWGRLGRKSLYCLHTGRLAAVGVRCQSIFPGCRQEWARKMNTVSMDVVIPMAFPLQSCVLLSHIIFHLWLSPLHPARQVQTRAPDQMGLQGGNATEFLFRWNPNVWPCVHRPL